MSTFYAREHRGQPGNERWRSQGDHRIVATRNCEAQPTGQGETRKVQRPLPCPCLSQANRAQTNDFDLFPPLTPGKTQSRIVIAMPARNYRNFVPPFGQATRCFSQLLSRGYDVWVETLIEEEDLHSTVIESESIGLHSYVHYIEN